MKVVEDVPDILLYIGPTSWNIQDIIFKFISKRYKMIQ